MVFDLEKKKIIEEKKMYKEERSKRNEANRQFYESIENFYRNKTQILKENLHSEKIARRNAEIAQKRV